MTLNRVLKNNFHGRTLEALRYIRYGRLNWDERKQAVPVVGMITKEEEEFYSSCTSRLGGKSGVIVDLGCWMGATAFALAQGVTQKDEAVSKEFTKIYAFDRFIWESWMDSQLPRVFCRYLPGDSFLPEARRRLEGCSDTVELVKADLSSCIWANIPIKLLLVDAMKTWELARSITRSFFSSLTEQSILIHQDFKHFYTPWIHILQYRLREHFRVIQDVPASGTLAFEMCQLISPSIAHDASDFDHVSDQEVSDAFQYSISLVDEAGKSAVAAAHIMYFVHKHRRSDAWSVFEHYRMIGFSMDHRELQLVKRSLDKMTP